MQVVRILDEDQQRHVQVVDVFVLDTEDTLVLEPVETSVLDIDGTVGLEPDNHAVAAQIRVDHLGSDWRYLRNKDFDIVEEHKQLVFD